MKLGKKMEELMHSRKARMYKNGFIKGNPGWMDRRKKRCRNLLMKGNVRWNEENTGIKHGFMKENDMING